MSDEDSKCLSKLQKISKLYIYIYITFCLALLCNDHKPLKTFFSELILWYPYSQWQAHFSH